MAVVTHVRIPGLPMVVRQLVKGMYAGGTGFSGPQMLDFFSQYLPEVEGYPWAGSPSRATMFETCLARIESEQLKRVIADLAEYNGPMKHGAPDSVDVEKLRAWLGEGPLPPAAMPQAVQALNWTAVRRDWEKAAERTREDPAGALTSARSLLESVCRHVLEARAIPYNHADNLQTLYRTTARNLNLSPEQQAEDLFRQVLGGCHTVANGVAGLRNQFSDAHGRGGSDAAAAIRHARLGVNAACTIALFLMETHLEQGG